MVNVTVVNDGNFVISEVEKFIADNGNIIRRFRISDGHTYHMPPKQTKDEAIKYVSLHDLW